MTKAVNLGISLRLGVPFEGSHNQDYGFLGLYLGPHILGNYHLGGRAGAYKATDPVLEEFWGCRVRGLGDELEALHLQCRSLYRAAECLY